MNQDLTAHQQILQILTEAKSEDEAVLKLAEWMRKTTDEDALNTLLQMSILED